MSAAWLTLMLLGSAAAVEPERQRSAALFEALYPVFSHPRCVNCHAGSAPRAGNGSHPHLPPVPLGPDGFGTEELLCSVCHSNHNTPVAPGAEAWQAAPAEMRWFSLTAAELCRRLTDKNSNGGRDLAGLEYHMRSSPTVRWSWRPGGLLEPPPLPRAEFRRRLGEWLASGGHCPD